MPAYGARALHMPCAHGLTSGLSNSCLLTVEPIRARLLVPRAHAAQAAAAAAAARAAGQVIERGRCCAPARLVLRPPARLVPRLDFPLVPRRSGVRWANKGCGRVFSHIGGC